MCCVYVQYPVMDHRVLLRLLPVLTPRVPLPLLPMLDPRVLVWLLLGCCVGWSFECGCVLIFRARV